MKTKRAPKTDAKRVVVRVQFSAKMEMWGVGRPGAKAGYYVYKADAVRTAAWECDYLYRNSGIRTQLVIHNKDGRIQSERTYGGDPVRRKG